MESTTFLLWGNGANATECDGGNTNYFGKLKANKAFHLQIFFFHRVVWKAGNKKTKATALKTKL